MFKRPGVAVFWDYETCPVPCSLVGTRIGSRIRTFVDSLYDSEGPQRMYPFEAHVDLRMAGRRLKDHTYIPKPQGDSESTWSADPDMMLVDCPHNHREQSVDASIIRAMLAYATRDAMLSTATIVLITGDDHPNSNFTYPVSTLKFLDHRVILVTANPEPTALKESASSVYNWFIDIIFCEPGRSPGSQGPQQNARSQDYYSRYRCPSLPPRSDIPESSQYVSSDADSFDDGMVDPRWNERFNLLVRCLEFYRLVGCPRPQLYIVAQSIAKSRMDSIYEGFMTVENYILDAQRSGVVGVGGSVNDPRVWLTVDVVSSNQN